MVYATNPCVAQETPFGCVSQSCHIRDRFGKKRSLRTLRLFVGIHPDRTRGHWLSGQGFEVGPGTQAYLSIWWATYWKECATEQLVALLAFAEVWLILEGIVFRGLILCRELGQKTWLGHYPMPCCARYWRGNAQLLEKEIQASRFSAFGLYIVMYLFITSLYGERLYRIPRREKYKKQITWLLEYIF